MRFAWIIAAFLAGPVSAQQSDKDFLTTYLQDSLSVAGRVVTITGFAGALSAQATMAEMTIADDQGVWLRVKDARLDWSRSALLSGQVVIDELSAAEIDLERMPARAGSGMPAAEPSGFSLPDLPVSIAIGDISAKRIVLGAAVLGQGVEGTLKASLQLAGGQGQAKLVLARTDGPKGVFDLAASYANATGQLVLALSAAEDAGGVSVRLLGVPGLPSAELTIAGDGPVTGFAADVSLKTDGAVRLAGKVALTGDTGGTGFTADLAGDPTPVFLPQYAAFFGPDLRLHAVGKRGADGRLDLSQFSLKAQAIAVDGSLSLDATGTPASPATVTLVRDDARVTVTVSGNGDIRVGS